MNHKKVENIPILTFDKEREGSSKQEHNNLVSMNICFRRLNTTVTTSSEKVVISMIRAYQKHAPDRIRKQCRFQPCCSEYMILSIKAHGMRNGIRKGIQRIKRCHPPNGGVDYP